LVIDIQDLRVRKIGAFASLDGGNKGVLGGKVPRERISSWEVLKAIEKRAEFEEPNELTTFLGSLAATRGEPIGERLPVVEEDSTRGLLVRSLRAPAVRLTPSQARILSEAYI
jgi:type IV secretory pathway ATPase VirB11/archaellum biosynthesis ATPase